MRLFSRGLAIAAMAACALSLMTARADDSVGPGQTLKNGKPVGKGWVALVNGKDLKGWKHQPEYWKAENGMMHGVTPGTKEHHYAYTEKEYADFELHADVKLVGYNSGICIRIKPTSFDDVPGYQVDMGEGYWGCLWDERGRGMVSKYEKADADKILHKDDWNHYYVIAKGHHIQAWLNGTKTIDIDDEKGNLTGPIGFQLCHGEGNKTDASFKNVYVKLLPSPH
jgi:hypothetical protein